MASPTPRPPEAVELNIGDPAAEQQAANDLERAAEFMLLRLQSFTENMERIAEAVVVILLGSLLRAPMLRGEALVLAPLLFCAIRPASVLLGFIGAAVRWREKAVVARFGIRGMASVY